MAELREYHAEVEVLGAITLVIPVQAESKTQAMAIAKQKYETLAPHQYQQAIKDSLDSENVAQEFEPRDKPRVLNVCEPKSLFEVLRDLDQIAKGEGRA